MELAYNQQYQVKPDHKYHPNRMGRFQFLGGPKRDCVVLSEVDDPNHLFVVGLHDLVDLPLLQEAIHNKCVHTEHCDYNFCKYGEEDSCPVYLGLKEPSFPVSERPEDTVFVDRQEDNVW